MIIADIGYHKFALQDLADAEALLRIVNTATPVGLVHDSDYNPLYFKTKSGARLEVALTHQPELLSEEDAQSLKDRRKSDSEVE